MGVRGSAVVISKKHTITLKNVRVNQRVYFLNPDTGVLSESYTIGAAKIATIIGQFSANGTYNPLATQSFLQRRSNLHGLQLRLLFAQQIPNLYLRNQVHGMSDN